MPSRLYNTADHAVLYSPADVRTLFLPLIDICAIKLVPVATNFGVMNYPRDGLVSAQCSTAGITVGERARSGLKERQERRGRAG